MYYYSHMAAIQRGQKGKQIMEIKCSKVLREKKLAVLWQVTGGDQAALEAAGFQKEFMGDEFRMIKVCRTQVEALQTQTALKLL